MWWLEKERGDSGGLWAAGGEALCTIDLVSSAITGTLTPAGQFGYPSSRKWAILSFPFLLFFSSFFPLLSSFF